MNKLISLILLLSVLSTGLLFISSCSPSTEDPGLQVDPDDLEDGDDEDDNDNDTDNSSDSNTDGVDKYNSQGIIIPEYKDYGRSTKKFSVFALDYVRPDVDALCDTIYEVSQLIRDNAVSFDEQVAAIESIEDDYEGFYSMLTTAEIFNSADVTNSYWSGEYAYLSTKSPEFSKAVEDIFVAAAASPYRERFEEEYFKTDLGEYASGGKYTDEVVELMSREAELEAQYKSISTSNVTITFKTKDLDITDTYDNVMMVIEQFYGSTTSTSYKQAKMLCDSYYRTAVSKLQTEIYVLLVTIRADLARAMGYESYIELAYDNMGYDYSPDTIDNFIDSIASDVYPVYRRLATVLFNPYFSSNSETKQSYASLVNTAYITSSKIGSEFGDIFGFMLQNELYDIAPSSLTRFDASFTSYIGANDSPFTFITTTGYVSDYLTIAHEFGHFIDYYVNNDSLNSLELAEVCSQGFEFLSLIAVKAHATEKTYKYLKYDALASAFEVLIEQGLFAAFEHSVYEADPETINVQKLEELAREAAARLLGTGDGFDLSNVMIPHLFIAPMYVQSYCTSIVPALEIYLLETDNAGAGISAYSDIINRPTPDVDFLTALSAAGLSSPFKAGLLSDISDKLYYNLTGMHYKQSSSNQGNAA